MENIRDIVQDFSNDLRIKVISHQFNKVNFLDEPTKDILIFYTNKFSLQDALIIDSNNPVLYAKVVIAFLKYHFVEHASTKAFNENFNEYLNNAMSDYWWDFVDVLGEFARNNVDKIKKGE